MYWFTAKYVLKYVLAEQVTTPKLHVTYAKAKEIQGQVLVLTYADVCRRTLTYAAVC